MNVDRRIRKSCLTAIAVSLDVRNWTLRIPVDSHPFDLGGSVPIEGRAVACRQMIELAPPRAATRRIAHIVLASSELRAR